MSSASLIDGGLDDQVALVAADESISYRELRTLVDDLRGELSGLLFLRAELNPASVSCLVAALELGAPVLPLDAELAADSLARLIDTYRPALVVGFVAEPPDGYGAATLPGLDLPVWRRQDPASPTAPELALLLSTSGSTGSPKLVRLSRAALLANADAIITGLGIQSSDKAITALPYSYTYGLSIITSHLRAGATVVISDATVVSAGFWQAVRDHQVTSLAGVPTTYQLLKRMRWDVASYPSVRYATQAGGRLPDADREHFRDQFTRAGATFYVMYGQTEATARITITRPGDLMETIATAGRVISGGALEIRHGDERGVGEVWYRGPNVMLGYAEAAADLAKPDELGGLLNTGDLGYLDGELLFLTGRSKRIAKVFGKRVSLDDVDQWLAQRTSGVSVAGDDQVVAFVVDGDEAELRAELAGLLHVHPSGVRVVRLAELPLLSSGKVDYQDLNRRAVQ